jgi:hypothetical protein
MYREQKVYKNTEVLCYLRKSRSDDPAFAVEEVLQKHERILQEYAEKNLGGAVPEEQIYREVASSETIDGRPEMLRLLRAIESPRIRAVIVVDVQRLSRGDLEDAGRLIKLLRYTNTAVITPQKAYDLSDDYDRDFFERELKRGNEYLEYFKKIQERGRVESVREGNFIGSKPPYGYNRAWVVVNKKKCPTLVENKEQADVVRMIFDMYVNQNMGVCLIGNYLNSLHIPAPRGERWSYSSIRDMLTNVHYIGKVRWNWRKTKSVVEDQEVRKTRPRYDDYMVYDGKHAAIISEELFNAAQEKKGRNARVKCGESLSNPLAGLIYCKCGHAMTLRKYKRKDGKERCAPRLLCTDQSFCGYGSVRYDDIVIQIRSILQDTIANFEIKIKNNDADNERLHQKMIRNLEQKAVDLEEKELKQWDMYSSGEMPEKIFEKLNANLQKEKEETKEALKKAYASAPDPVDYEEKLLQFRDALTAFGDPDLSAEYKNAYLKKVIDRVICTRERPVRISKKNCEKYGYAADSLKVGGTWSNPKTELDVHLKI